MTGTAIGAAGRSHALSDRHKVEIVGRVAAVFLYVLTGRVMADETVDVFFLSEIKSGVFPTIPCVTSRAWWPVASNSDAVIDHRLLAAITGPSCPGVKGPLSTSVRGLPTPWARMAF
jgi:hypothetical protein